jgi:hypothetical protein
MASITLWARDGEAGRQAVAWGESAPLETASEELTEACLLCAIASRRLKTWAAALPEPRSAPEIGMEVIVLAHRAARFAGRYSRRQAGYGRRSGRVVGALGYSVEVRDPAQGLSLRGTAADQLLSGAVVRKRLVQREQQAAGRQPPPLPPPAPRVALKARARASRRAVTSRRPWMQRKPRREPSRSQRHGCAGTPTRVVSRCCGTPAWGGADGCTSAIRPMARCPYRLGRMRAGGSAKPMMGRRHAATRWPRCARGSPAPVC